MKVGGIRSRFSASVVFAMLASALPILGVTSVTPAVAYTYSCNWADNALAASLSAGDIASASRYQQVVRNCGWFVSQDADCIYVFSLARSLATANATGNSAEVSALILNNVGTCDSTSGGGGNGGGGGGGGCSVTTFTSSPKPIIGVKSRNPLVFNEIGPAWSPSPNYSWQWYRNNRAIRGADDSEYSPTRADLNKVVTVKLTGTLDCYKTTTKTSSGKKVTASMLGR